jgi:hypothetical protein
MNRTGRGKTASRSTGSTLCRWFDTINAPPVFGTFSSPSIRSLIVSRKKARNIGLRKQ